MTLPNFVNQIPIFSVLLTLTIVSAGCGSSETQVVESSVESEPAAAPEPALNIPAADQAAGAVSANAAPDLVKPPTTLPGQPLDYSGDSAPDLEAPDGDGNAVVDMTDRYEVVNPDKEAARTAFVEPELAKRLSPDANLWADVEKGRLIVDGYIALQQGPLEMFACPVGTKEHESVVAVLAKAREVHAGLLAIGADSGTPVAFSPEYRPATGQRIAIWVMWRDKQNAIKKVPAQQLVQNIRTEKPLESDWVFAGSSFWKDPETGREYYQADSGDLICVSNFSTATLDLPVESSQSNNDLQFGAFTENIPPSGTPVRLVLVPIPLPGNATDGGNPTGNNVVKADPAMPPEDALVSPAQ